jgi:hypothetical protein
MWGEDLECVVVLLERSPPLILVPALLNKRKQKKPTRALLAKHQGA